MYLYSSKCYSAFHPWPVIDFYYHFAVRLVKGLDVEKEFVDPPALALFAALVARAAAAWA